MLVMRMEAAGWQHHAAYAVYFQACQSDGCEHYATISDAPLVFFQRLLDNAAGRRLSLGSVPTRTWFAVDNGGRIVGAIRLRLGTTPLIHDVCGHIGYEVLPLARQLGVAGRMLAFIQRTAPPQLDDGWLVSCDDDNLASRRTIERAGGVLLDCRCVYGQAVLLRRYFLPNSAAFR